MGILGRVTGHPTPRASRLEPKRSPNPGTMRPISAFSDERQWRPGPVHGVRRFASGRHVRNRCWVAVGPLPRTGHKSSPRFWYAHSLTGVPATWTGPGDPDAIGDQDSERAVGWQPVSGIPIVYCSASEVASNGMWARCPYAAPREGAWESTTPHARALIAKCTGTRRRSF